MSSNALKYFRWVAFFLVFLYSFSIGLNSGENLGQAIGVRLTKLLDHLAAFLAIPGHASIVQGDKRCRARAHPPAKA